MALMYCPNCQQTQIGVRCFNCGMLLIKRER